ncbi:MAG: FHA domain-containing protein [Candidatus Melainabacteria bacterium]|nr:FHA domain-containing protein [Candidatus Melainabacteria bacterium]
MTSAFTPRHEESLASVSYSDGDKTSADAYKALRNEVDKIGATDSHKLTSEFKRLLSDADSALVKAGILSNPLIVDYSDAEKKPIQTDKSSQPERDKQQDKATLDKTADELYRAIHKGIYLHASSRSDRVNRLVDSLSKEDRQDLERIYNEKYGTKERPDALRKDLQENLTELRFRRTEATLNREDGRTNDAGALMAALAYANETPEKGNAQVRAVLSTLNSKEIQHLSADFKKHYGKSFQDALSENKSLTQTTRDTLSILEKGIDKRTSEDIVKMAELGLESGDKRLFTESLRGNSKEAAEARKLILTDEKLKETIVDKFPSEARRCGRTSDQSFENNVDEVVLDYLKDGRISLATITKNNTDDFTGMLDNPENVDLAVRNATEREKKDYTVGRKLTEAKTEPKNDEEKQALEFYTKLKKAFVEGGGERKAAVWEDQLLNGRESILSEMYKTHDWSGHSTRELLRRVEQLNKEDWTLLKGPQGKEFRQQIDKSLKLYASDEERQRIGSLLDKKVAASTFEESQNVQRSLEDTVKDSKKTLLGIGTGYDAATIIRRLETMSADEARKYKDDPQYRKQLNELIDDNFSDAEKTSARRILKQVETTGLPAKLEQIDKILQSKVNGDKPEQTVRLAEELLKDPNTRSRFNSPDSELSDEERATKKVIAGAVRELAKDSGRFDIITLPAIDNVTQTFFEQGRLSSEMKLLLGMSKKDVIAEIATAPDKEREAALSSLSDDERKVAESIAQNADKSPSIADRIRAYTLGLGGECAEFKDALKEMSYDQRRWLKSEYARKYGINLENDFLKKVNEKDRSTYKELLTPAKTDARQRFYENHAAMLKSDSGWSADGSKLTLERATTLYSTALEEYQKIYKTLPQEKQEALDKYFSESLEQYKDSKERLAEVMVDAVITATALAAAPFTAGTSLALVASIAAGVGATARVATMAAIQGSDFEATPENIAKHLTSGAAIAALNFIPFGAATRGKSLLRMAGENAAVGAFSNVTSDLIVTPFSERGVNWESLAQSALMGAAMGATIPVALHGLGKVVNVTKKLDGLHIDTKSLKEPLEVRNLITGEVRTIKPGEVESLRINEWQPHRPGNRPKSAAEPQIREAAPDRAIVTEKPDSPVHRRTSDAPFFSKNVGENADKKASNFIFTDLLGNEVAIPSNKEMILGRNGDLQINSPMASRKHARLRTEGDRYYIEDLNSKLGTFVNGKRISAEVEIKPGDRISFGRYDLDFGKVRPKVAVQLNGESFSINKDTVSIGRGGDIQVATDHKYVSRNHAEMRWAGDRYVIKNNSQNGTFVNGVKVNGEVAVKIGDRVRLGNRPDSPEFRLGVPDKSQLKLDSLLKSKEPLPLVEKSMSPSVLKQSNDYANNHQLSARIEDGFANAGAGTEFNSSGKFDAGYRRAATVVDRQSDPILAATIADAKQRFAHLPPEERAHKLSHYVKNLLEPGSASSHQDDLYDLLNNRHDGKRVLLGEYIRLRQGVCSQQALLLKVLSDEFPDMRCTYVRGSLPEGNHAWVEFDFGKGARVFDPRNPEYNGKRYKELEHKKGELHEG